MAGAASPGNLGDQASVPVGRRPGLVTFAAVMMFLLAGLEAMTAITQFFNAAWIAANVSRSVGGPLWVWGIIDGVFAIAAFYAGYDILRGGTMGRVLGIVIAGFDALRWYFFIPAAPWAALVVIAVDILIIYALAIHGEFFRTARTPTS
jgi:hypothetical protein